MHVSHIGIKIYRSVDKANSKIFQFNFASFHFTAFTFFPKHFICLVAYFTVENLLFAFSF